MKKYSPGKVLVTGSSGLIGNAITKCAKSCYSSEGAILYCTMSPCFDCSKLIIQSGIQQVYFIEAYRNLDGIDLLKKANIYVEQIVL